MKQLKHPATNIIGIELRTTNENGKAFAEIPPFWGKFFAEGIVAQIPNKQSNDVYAIYTNFANEGQNNLGIYSLIIGCPVTSLENIPEGFVSVELANGNYNVFTVKENKAELVGEAWQEIWALSESDKEWDSRRAYKAEFELYSESGEIEIFIGMKD